MSEIDEIVIDIHRLATITTPESYWMGEASAGGRYSGRRTMCWCKAFEPLDQEI